jgi:hypothetical protein
MFSIIYGNGIHFVKVVFLLSGDYSHWAHKRYYKHVQKKPTEKDRHYQKRKINDRESKKFYFVVNECVKITLKKGYV